MNHRDNFLAAMHRQPCERVPFQFSLCDSQLDTLEKIYGSRDFVRIFDMPMEYVSIGRPDYIPDYRPYHKDPDSLSFIDDWGVGHQRGSIAHFTHFVSPMADFTTPEEVEDFPLPGVMEDHLWTELEKRVEEVHAQGRAAVYMAIQVFEPAWYLRGLENMLMDFLADEEMAAACMNRMTEIQCKIAARAAASGVDMIVFGDDVGSQRALMMSMETWRRWVKPATAATIAAARAVRPDILCMYHSDGVIYDVIPELIEVGMDILNPVQPECVDPVLLKKQYGDRLSFHGTVGTQTVMPFGTALQVRDTVHRMIDIVGEGGGLTIAPTHLLEPEVPWENIEAFVRAVNDFGRY